MMKRGWIWIALVLITGVAGRAAAQGIASPVFEGAGQTDMTPNDLTVDAEGNFYYTTSISFEDPGDDLDFDPGPAVVALNAAGTQKMFIVAKVDPERNLEWLKTVPYSGSVVPGYIHVDTNDDVIVTGSVHTAQTIDFGEPGNSFPVNIPEHLKFIWKLDAEGTTLWVKALDENVGFSSVFTAADGSVYVAVNLNGTADVDPGPGVFLLTPPGMVIVKLTAEGNFLWAKQFLTTSNTLYGETAVGTDGLLYMALVFSDQIDADPGPGTQNFFTNPATDRDTVLVCLNVNGDLQWATQNSRNSPQQLELDGDGGLLLLDGGVPLVQGDGPYITRYSLSGTLLWARETGKPSMNTYRTLVIGDDNDFYIVGFAFAGDSIGTSPTDRSYYSVPEGGNGLFVARWDLGATQLWCTLLRSVDGASFTRVFKGRFTADGRLVFATEISGPVDVDPSSISEHIVTPYTSFTPWDTVFLTLAGSDEVWLQFDLAPRQMDGSEAYSLRAFANAIRAIQPGQTINIKSTGAGVASADTGTFSKPMKLRAVGGVVRIGVQP